MYLYIKTVKRLTPNIPFTHQINLRLKPVEIDTLFCCIAESCSQLALTLIIDRHSMRSTPMAIYVLPMFIFLYLFNYLFIE